MKALEEMTTDELAALFPIILVPHQDAWQGWFMRESARLRALLPLEQIYRGEHHAREPEEDDIIAAGEHAVGVEIAQIFRVVRGTVKSYAQNSLQAAERSVVMQWRDR